MAKDEGFKLAVPTFATDIKQGEVRAVTVSLQRGAYFKQGVKLQIQASKGISVDPTNVLVKASESPDIQLRIAPAPSRGPQMRSAWHGRQAGRRRHGDFCELGA